ncbi:MAG: hypothetical protein K6D38_03735 [Pseudobutyrivibrio sp.]|nr:hypothetical protein [Pseudobutyrivibrio sp.]
MARKDKERVQSRIWNIIGKNLYDRRINKGAIKNLNQFSKEMSENNIIPEGYKKRFKENTEQIINDIKNEKLSIWRELKNFYHKKPTERSTLYKNAIRLASGVAAYYSNVELFNVFNNNENYDFVEFNDVSKNADDLETIIKIAILERNSEEKYNCIVEDFSHNLYDYYNKDRTIIHNKKDIKKLSENLKNKKVNDYIYKPPLKQPSSTVYYYNYIDETKNLRLEQLYPSVRYNNLNKKTNKPLIENSSLTIDKKRKREGNDEVPVAKKLRFK